MVLSSHQSVRFFATAKTQKYEKPSEINERDLKIRPIIDQTGSCFHNLGKFFAEYLLSHATNSTR